MFITPQSALGRMLIRGGNMTNITNSPGNLISVATTSTKSAPSNLLAPLPNQTWSAETESSPPIGNVSSKEQKSFFENIMQVAKKLGIGLWTFINEHKAVAAALASIVAILTIFGRRK
jgi:hypothetical protein